MVEREEGRRGRVKGHSEMGSGCLDASRERIRVIGCRSEDVESSLQGVGGAKRDRSSNPGGG